MSIPAKTTPTCSNIYLIDENLCIGNSLNIINYNVASLSSALVFLENYQTNWNNLYTNFQAYSAVWVHSVTNVQNFSANWVSFSNTIQSLSASWNKPYTIFCPSMIEINQWNNLTNLQKNQYAANWLTISFPPNNYNNNQIIYTTFYLYESKQVSFNFQRSYDENCTPNCNGVSVGCNGDSCPPLVQGCNHHGGLAGVKACDNVYGYCSKQATYSAPQNVSCVGNGGRTLNIALNNYSSDTHVAETVTIAFININNTWTVY
jgi:hypothetical protein